VAEKLALTVQYASRLHNLPDEADFRLWAVRALDRPAEITVRIVNAAEGRNLNSAFRGKDYATNVLTFVYHAPRAKKLQGDLVLCAPVVAREAREQKKLLHDHYAHLVVHGLLHLAGYDHENTSDAAKMEKREIAILTALDIANPYL
jgi:probable rRNA maturation factor